MVLRIETATRHYTCIISHKPSSGARTGAWGLTQTTIWQDLIQKRCNTLGISTELIESNFLDVCVTKPTFFSWIYWTVHLGTQQLAAVFSDGQFLFFASWWEMTACKIFTTGKIQPGCMVNLIILHCKVSRKSQISLRSYSENLGIIIAKVRQVSSIIASSQVKCRPAPLHGSETIYWLGKIC